MLKDKALDLLHPERPLVFQHASPTAHAQAVDAAVRFNKTECERVFQQLSHPCAICLGEKLGTDCFRAACQVDWSCKFR